MSRNKKLLQILILGAVLIVGGYTIAISLVDKQAGPPKVGEQAPNFSLVGLNGEEVELKDYQGKTVFVNFWGTFCPPCVNEMPLLETVHNEYADHMVVLGVNLDEPKLTVSSFVERTGVTFPILLDDMTVQKQYGVGQYPTTIVINPAGKIIDIKLGEFETKEEIVRYW